MNAALVFEIALLILLAFLAGAVVGTLARWLFARTKPAAEPVVKAAAEGAPARAPAADDLVKAPAIAPLRSGPTAAERLAAAGGMSSTVVMPKVSLPQAPAIEPSRRPGETVSGRHIDNPEHPAPPASAPATVAALAVAPELPAAAASEIVSAPAPAPDVAAPAVPENVAPEPTADATDERLPVEERIEPALPSDDLVVTDTPAELAAELQDVVETDVAGEAPAVVAEAPLVEPAVEREQHEDAAVIADPIVEVAAATEVETDVPAITPAADPAPASPAAEPAAEKSGAEVDDELAAMRAIEGGWRPRRPAAPRKPADLPEGVSPAHVAEAAKAVEKSGAAVANALATAAAVLEEIGPASGAGRPVSLDAPRNGAKDDFSRIKGLAPAIESALNGLGIYHFDQIAGWDESAVAWVETHFGFKGRIARERWQEQARDLAAAPASSSETATP